MKEVFEYHRALWGDQVNFIMPLLESYDYGSC